MSASELLRQNLRGGREKRESQRGNHEARPVLGLETRGRKLNETEMSSRGKKNHAAPHKKALRNAKRKPLPQDKLRTGKVRGTGEPQFGKKGHKKKHLVSQ